MGWLHQTSTDKTNRRALNPKLDGQQRPESMQRYIIDAQSSERDHINSQTYRFLQPPAANLTCLELLMLKKRSICFIDMEKSSMLKKRSTPKKNTVNLTSTSDNEVRRVHLCICVKMMCLKNNTMADSANDQKLHVAKNAYINSEPVTPRR